MGDKDFSWHARLPVSGAAQKESLTAFHILVIFLCITWFLPKRKSPPASLPLIGWVVQRTTVNWLIADFLLTHTCD